MRLSFIPVLTLAASSILPVISGAQEGSVLYRSFEVGEPDADVHVEMIYPPDCIGCGDLFDILFNPGLLDDGRPIYATREALRDGRLSVRYTPIYNDNRHLQTNLFMLCSNDPLEALRRLSFRADTWSYFPHPGRDDWVVVAPEVRQTILERILTPDLMSKETLGECILDQERYDELLASARSAMQASGAEQAEIRINGDAVTEPRDAVMQIRDALDISEGDIRGRSLLAEVQRAQRIAEKRRAVSSHSGDQ